MASVSQSKATQQWIVQYRFQGKPISKAFRPDEEEDAKVFHSQVERAISEFKKTLRVPPFLQSQLDARVGREKLIIRAVNKEAAEQRESKTNPTIQSLLDDFIKIRATSRAAITLYAYKVNVPLAIAKMGIKRVNDIDHHKIARYITAMVNEGKSPFTPNRYIRDMRTILNWAVKTGRIKNNPIKGFELKERTVNEKPWITLEQLNHLLKCAVELGNRDIILMILCCGFAGMRPKEAQSLRWEHIRLADGNGYFCLPESITKTRRARNVPIQPIVRKHLIDTGGWNSKTQTFEKSGLVIKPDSNGRSFLRWDFRHKWADVLEKAEMKQIQCYGKEFNFNIYTLRHTYISLLMQSGKHSIHKIAKWAGNSIKICSETYGHLDPTKDTGEF